MIHKKRIQALGLACLVGLMSLGPAAESLAAVSWTKNNGVYIGSDGTSIAGVVARGIDVSHWKQAIDWKAVAGDDIQFVMLGTRYNNAVDPYFKPLQPALRWELIYILMPLQLTWRFRKQILFLI